MRDRGRLLQHNQPFKHMPRAVQGDLGDYTLDLRSASIAMCLPQDVVMKCVGRVARGLGGKKLSRRLVKGEPFFREVDIREYLADLSEPWVETDDTKRAPIPTYFQEALRLETDLLCGVCGSSNPREFAHIVPWDECRHNHPWNLLSTCTACHSGYDIYNTISQDEMLKAKKLAQASYRRRLGYTFMEAGLLDYLKSFTVAFNGQRVSGIDFFLSMVPPSGKGALEITVVRGDTLLRMIGPGYYSGTDFETLVRFLETTSSVLENSRYFEPLWADVAKSLYIDGLYPYMTIPLTPIGERIIEGLFADADKYISPQKYRGMEKLSAKEVFQRVVKAIDEENDRRYSGDGAPPDEWIPWHNTIR